MVRLNDLPPDLLNTRDLYQHVDIYSICVLNMWSTWKNCNNILLYRSDWADWYQVVFLEYCSSVNLLPSGNTDNFPGLA